MNPLNDFLSENYLSLEKKISKGWSSEIFLARDSKGRKYVLKCLREKSNRRHMSQREMENLRLANSFGIGPKWLGTDFERNIVVMEFIDGVPFSEWVSGKLTKKGLERFIEELFSQAHRLDELGLDHGQLAGRGKNILVRSGLPVIIDFEKASAQRKCHNVKVLQSFLFKSPGSWAAKRVKEIMGYRQLPSFK